MKKTLKKITCGILAAVSVFGCAATLTACETSHPEVEMKVEFNGETYTLDYKLYRELAPQTVKHFLWLADNGYYDGLCVHDYSQNDYLRLYTGAYSVAEAEDDADGLGGEAVQDDRPTMKAAVAYAKTLAEEVFPDLPVGFLHGKMKPAEKDAIMHRFSTGEILILVSTTVIEVGVNVPTATLMVVENAEYFGLSQLHQLRGRVGRGRDKSWCILVSDNKGETARQRLEIMCKTNNGYEIAERDLELRGPGDFFAANPDGISYDVRQSGGLRFAIASFCDDMEFLQRAFCAADEIAAFDPLLEKSEHALLREAMEQRFGVVVL